ncbi:DUF4856 domain-containing protein [Fodinibius halophilus]|uniref:DUF4856 domain-containing protein n=1 Tax=Fodinibius halophilus TaxID=1736908 RepID=A0A6M1TB61_9BACT|nr:DUF4856 domain-containing protein [Fodinibius halophilus]NGP89261.1 DUF4856 domain-containing protein [Fodinibius halophilus]
MTFKKVVNIGIAVTLTAFTFGCNVNDGDDNETISPPDNYEFSRDGSSSVAYPGQTDRLKMLDEIDSYVGKGDKGEELSEQALLDMYENKDGNGGGNFDFTSDRQLKNKTFPNDLDNNFYENLFAQASAASKKGTQASNGQAGLIARADGDNILVDANGREFGQLIEKGLMGSVFYHQIFNVYLTDDRIGPDVDNSNLEEGKNYTAKEHHFDEAFGYFGAPVDFESDWPESRESEAKFWADYSNGSDAELGFNDILMDAFIKGRTAIVNKDQTALTEQVDILYEKLELLAAATTIHYINSTLDHLSAGEQGEAFHTLSEAWAFANALKYSPRRKITVDQLTTIQETDFGDNGNFWNVDSKGLNKAKSTLVEIYPELKDVQDQL